MTQCAFLKPSPIGLLPKEPCPAINNGEVRTLSPENDAALSFDQTDSAEFGFHYHSIARFRLNPDPPCRKTLEEACLLDGEHFTARPGRHDHIKDHQCRHQ
jgi:hypothetical protein